MKKIRNLFMVMALFGVIMPIWAEKIKGNGKVVTKEIQVAEYESVHMGSQPNRNGNLFQSKKKSYKTTLAPTFYYTQSDKASLTITTDENLLPYFEIEVKSNKLEIAIKEGTTLSPTKLEFNGSSQELHVIEMHSDGYFYLQSALNGQKLEVSVAGSGEIYLNEPVQMTKCETSVAGDGHVEMKQLTCEKMEVSITGGSDVELAGKATKQEINIVGSGEVHAFDFLTEAVDFSSVGSGSAEVYASERIEASMVGGSLYYKGDPEIESSNVGGKIRHAN